MSKISIQSHNAYVQYNNSYKLVTVCDTPFEKGGIVKSILSMHFSTRSICKNVWLVIGNYSSRTMPVNQRGACFMGVSLEVIGPGVGITLKKTKLVSHNISLVNVLESEYNNWSCCSCDNFEGIITSSNNDPARKTGWFQSRVLVCISMMIVAWPFEVLTLSQYTFQCTPV